jgi:acyl-coenzyme A synthetase/AMP-(fatty) acid ligase
LPNGPEWFAFFLALQRARLAAVPLDGGLPADGCVETARLAGAAGLNLDGELRVLDAPRRRADSCACVKLTSGTSSQPKTILCTAQHLLADGRNIIATMKIARRDINLALIPLGHSYGLGNLVMPLILQGTAVVCAGPSLPRQWIGWIRRHRVTVLPGVPALLRVMAALPADEGRLPSLRKVISAGAMLAPEVAQAFHARFGVRIHNFYGSSETGGICYDRTGGASLDGRSVGRPMRGVTVAVKARRITVSSGAVASRGGRWRLADFGEWNARGELVLLGRAGQGANIGGRKVHPLEVERVLRALPGVSDAAVWLVREHERDVLVAGVESLRARGEIERELGAKLPAWKLPRACLVLPELPRTARGKVDLGSLRRRLKLG